VSRVRIPGAGWLLLLLTLALLLRLPAHLLAPLLVAVSPVPCRLAATAGTLWSGQGQLFIHNGERWFDLGPLAWEFLPGDALVRLRLGDGRIAWTSPRNIDIDGIVLPAASVLAQPALGLSGGSWQGTLVLAATQLQLPPGARSAWTGAGRLLWQNAGSSLLADQPLGDYRLDWQWDGSTRPRGSFSGGRPAAIEASGEVGASGVQAQVRLYGTVASVLAPYLALIGQASGGVDGYHVINLPWP